MTRLKSGSERDEATQLEVSNGFHCVMRMVCSRWRKQIRMIDDHNECEWVNVSSGTGSPGLSRTKSKEP